MQTFLPYPDFIKSASVLDKRRLGKQRVETLQIMQAIFGQRLVTTYARETENEEVIISTLEPSNWFFERMPNRGWRNHPAVRMWVGYERGLWLYQQAVCTEWIRRGYKDTCFEKTEFIFLRFGDPAGLITPPWMGDPGFHTSHQSNLIRKDRTFYEPYFPGVPGDIPYIWPS